MMQQQQKQKQQYQESDDQFAPQNLHKKPLEPEIIEPFVFNMSQLDVRAPSEIQANDSLEFSRIEFSMPIPAVQINQFQPQIQKVREPVIQPQIQDPQLLQGYRAFPEIKVDNDFSSIPMLPKLSVEPVQAPPIAQQQFQMPPPVQQVNNSYMNLSAAAAQQQYAQLSGGYPSFDQVPLVKNPQSNPPLQMKQPYAQVQPVLIQQSAQQVANQQAVVPAQMTEEEQLAEAIRQSEEVAHREQTLKQLLPKQVQPQPVVQLVSPVMSEEQQLAEAIRISEMEAKQVQYPSQVKHQQPQVVQCQMTEEQQMTEAIRLSNLEEMQRPQQIQGKLISQMEEQKEKTEYDLFLDKQKQEYEKLQKNRVVTLNMVANIIEDYFPKPKPLGAEFEASLQQKMKQNHDKFLANQKRIAIPEVMKDLLAVEKREEKPLENKDKEEIDPNTIVALKVIEIDGKQYLCHKVLIYDTLTGLSLKYNVSVQVLRQVNQLMGDSIFQKDELLVPVVAGMTVTVAPPPTVEQKAKREEDRRQSALMLLNARISEMLKQPRGDFKAEATYYLAENDFDYRKAADAYLADFKLEQERDAPKKKKKK